MKREPTVFVVDADGPTRDAVRNLADTMNLRCEAYASGRQFLSIYEISQPGCVVLEVRIPDINGLEIQDCLIARGSQIPLVFLSGQANVFIAVRAMRSGALNFCEKPFREHELWDAIHEAIALDKARRSRSMWRREVDKRLHQLSGREREVLAELAEGRSKEAIASATGVCVRTVEVRRRNLMKKLRLASHVELIRFALFACDEHLFDTWGPRGIRRRDAANVAVPGPLERPKGFVERPGREMEDAEGAGPHANEGSL